MVVRNISPQRRAELNADREREQQLIIENIEQTREFLRKSGRGAILEHYDKPALLRKIMGKIDQFFALLEWVMFILAGISLIVFVIAGVWIAFAK